MIPVEKKEINDRKIDLKNPQSLFFQGILSALILALPFLNLLHLFEPIKIFGKSAYIILPVMIIFILYLSLILSKYSKLFLVDLVIFFIIFLACMIFLIREWAYGEIIGFLDIRYIFTALVFLAFSYHIFKNANALHFISYAIVGQSTAIALVHSINFYLFPNVMISYGVDGGAFLNLDGERTRELLLGSSISANNMLCGMFVLLSLFKYKAIDLSRLTFISLQFFLMLSIFNTLSRYPIAIAIFLMIFSIFGIDKLRLKYILLLVAVFFGFLAVATMSDISLLDYLSRFSQGSGGRGDKLKATYILISNSPFDFLIGSSKDLIMSTIVNDAIISDNSYGLIATSFGVPFMLIFFAPILFILYKIITDKISLAMFFYIIFGFGLTNCILWEPWVFTVFISFVMVSYYGIKPIYKERNQLQPSF